VEAPKPTSTTTEPAKTPVHCEALDAARKAHAEVTAVGAPRYHGDGSRTSSLEFFTSQVRPWLANARRQVEAVEERYLRSVSVCPGEAFEAEAQLQGGLLWKWLGEQAMDAGRGAFPNTPGQDAEFEAAFISALTESMRPAWTAAETLLTACGSAQQSSATRTACRAALADLPKFPGAGAEPGKGESVCEAPELEPSRATDDCAFVGSLWADLELYTSEQGGVASMRTRRRDPVHVLRLELPSMPEGRIRIVIDRPIAFTGWAETPSGVVALREQTEVMPGHFWITPHTPLLAFWQRNALWVSAKIAEITAAQQLPWSKRTDCRSLGLLGPEADAAPAGDLARLKEGSVTLFAAVAGPAFASILSDGWTTVAIQETQAEWLRVRGNHPFRFDGWIRGSDLSQERPRGIMTSAPQCTHRANAALPLFLEAHAGAPAVAELPARGQLRVLSEEISKEFVAIAVPGVASTAPSGQFYVGRESLETATKPLGR
jgi:hypothetical protein